MAHSRVTDESGLLYALIIAAVRARTASADRLAVDVADEVLRGLQQMGASVVRMHALGPREDE